MNAPSPDQQPTVPPEQAPGAPPVQPPAAAAGGYPPPGYPPPGYPPPGYSYPPGYPQPHPLPYPPAVSPGGLPLASFLERLGAYLIDGVIIAAITMVIFIPVFVVFFATVPEQMASNDPSAPMDTVLMILGLEAVLLVAVWVITYLYHVEFMRRGGQTLGKKAMKLKVVPLNPAAVLTRRMCLLRYLVQFLAGGFVPFFSWVDGLWQLWDKPFQQCLHDKAAQTVVVRVQSL